MSKKTMTKLKDDDQNWKTTTKLKDHDENWKATTKLKERVDRIDSLLVMAIDIPTMVIAMATRIVKRLARG